MDNKELIRKVYSHYKKNTLFLFEENIDESNKKVYYKTISLLDDFYKYFKKKIEMYSGVNDSEVLDRQEFTLNVDRYEEEFMTQHIKTCVFKNIDSHDYLNNMSNKNFATIIDGYKKYSEIERSTT